MGLFADDCLLYRPIRSLADHCALQNDLRHLEIWAKNWGMSFNAKKCYTLRTRPLSSHFYDLGGTVLKEVTSNPYLGIQLSADMKWKTHIDRICNKAGSTLGFIKRTLRHCSQNTRKIAYMTLVRPILEYGAVIWDPYLKTDINRIEAIQRKAVRFICGDYSSRYTGSVTAMLHSIDLPTLVQRRKELRLTFLFKVVSGLFPALPPHKFLIPIRNTRQSFNRKYMDYLTDSTTVNIQRKNSKCFRQIVTETDSYKYSLFPRTIIDWNQLPDSVVTVETPEAFRSGLRSLSY